MANKRMFTMKVVDSDAFLDMPLSTQCLYFHLNMRADDDGFIGNPKRIMRLIGASDDDLKILIMKRFVLTFEDGVIVIKHWRMHNTLSQNRYRETQYLDEKSMLLLKDNGAYSLNYGSLIDDTKLICQKKTYDNVKKTETARQWLDNGSTMADSDIDSDSDSEKERDNNPPLSPQGEGAVKKSKKEIYFPDNSELNEAFEEFLTMRNKIKKPLATKNAVTRTKNRLNKLSGGNDALAIRILEQSIDHCWQDLYELKPDQNGGGNNGRAGSDVGEVDRDEYAEQFIALADKSRVPEMSRDR